MAQKRTFDDSSSSGSGSGNEVVVISAGGKQPPRPAPPGPMSTAVKKRYKYVAPKSVGGGGEAPNVLKTTLASYHSDMMHALDRHLERIDERISTIALDRLARSPQFRAAVQARVNELAERMRDQIEAELRKKLT
jgi:hypothetical protein